MPNGASIPLTRALTTLGAEPGVSYQLPVSVDFGPGNVRIWLANERFLLHDSSTRSRVQLNGRMVRWSFLGAGDELEIGGVKLRFESLGEARPGILRSDSVTT